MEDSDYYNAHCPKCNKLKMVKEVVGLSDEKCMLIYISLLICFASVQSIIFNFSNIHWFFSDNLYITMIMGSFIDFSSIWDTRAIAALLGIGVILIITILLEPISEKRKMWECSDCKYFFDRVSVSKKANQIPITAHNTGIAYTHYATPHTRYKGYKGHTHSMSNVMKELRFFRGNIIHSESTVDNMIYERIENSIHIRIDIEYDIRRSDVKNLILFYLKNYEKKIKEDDFFTYDEFKKVVDYYKSTNSYKHNNKVGIVYSTKDDAKCLALASIKQLHCFYEEEKQEK